jgi:hypothetical protein
VSIVILLIAVAVGGFFTAKLTMEFLDFMIEKLKQEDREE